MSSLLILASLSNLLFRKVVEEEVAFIKTLPHLLNAKMAVQDVGQQYNRVMGCIGTQLKVWFC